MFTGSRVFPVKEFGKLLAPRYVSFKEYFRTEMALKVEVPCPLDIIWVLKVFA